MHRKIRNEFADGNWVLKQVEDLSLCKGFDCGHVDLNEYFQENAPLHKQELLTQTYYLHPVEYPSTAYALLDFCNDSLHIEGNDKDLFGIAPAISKLYPCIPAVKLTRMGVLKYFQRTGIGTNTLNMVKKMFTTYNRTGCRIITVDAYNETEVINFYKNNGFQFLPGQENYLSMGKETIALYFDLKRFVTDI